MDDCMQRLEIVLLSWPTSSTRLEAAHELRGATELPAFCHKTANDAAPVSSNFAIDGSRAGTRT